MNLKRVTVNPSSSFEWFWYSSIKCFKLVLQMKIYIKKKSFFTIYLRGNHVGHVTNTLSNFSLPQTHTHTYSPEPLAQVSLNTENTSSVCHCKTKKPTDIISRLGFPIYNRSVGRFSVYLNFCTRPRTIWASNQENFIVHLLWKSLKEAWLFLLRCVLLVRYFLRISCSFKPPWFDLLINCSKNALNLHAY